MSEETDFWGVVVPGYTEEGYRTTVLLPGWRLVGPNNEPLAVYPVFSSKERAATFVRKHGAQLVLDGQRELVDKLVEDLRLIKRSEIQPEDYVLSDRKGLVTWADLLAEGE